MRFEVFSTLVSSKHYNVVILLLNLVVRMVYNINTFLEYKACPRKIHEYYQRYQNE